MNISEGRDHGRLAIMVAAAGNGLLDQHTDEHHHRTVFTLVGEDAPRDVTRAAVAAIDLRSHEGAHPRIGAVDVVPFVPLGDSTLADALAARDRFAAWAADELGLPTFRYGPERSLPDVRRDAFATLAPDFGPGAPHPRAGAIAVGARPLLVAYNLWLDRPDLALARALASAARGPAVRALGLQVGGRVQVSCNLIAPQVVGPAAIFDSVDREARAAGNAVIGAELVGLLPESLLRTIDPARWAQLDLSAERTIEHRLTQAGWPIPSAPSA